MCLAWVSMCFPKNNMRVVGSKTDLGHTQNPATRNASTTRRVTSLSSLGHPPSKRKSSK